MVSKGTSIFRTGAGATLLCVLASSAGATPVLVPYGTPVPVRLTHAINSREWMQGQMVDAEIAEDVTVGGQLVFRRGMPVWADISDLKKKAAFGVPGHIEVKVVFARAGEESVRITGSVRSKGSPGGPGLVAAGAVFGLPGAWVVTGRSGEIPAGTTLMTHVDEEKTVEVADGARVVLLNAPTGVSAR